MWGRVCESASQHLINPSWNMSNKLAWKRWNDIKAQPSIYRSMKVMGKDTFRHIQTNPPDLNACLNLIHVFPVFHLLCVATSSPVHWSLCLCQAQGAAELHWSQTNINLPTSHSQSCTHTHRHTYILYYTETIFTQQLLVNFTKKWQITHWIKHEFWSRKTEIVFYSNNLGFICNFFQRDSLSEWWWINGRLGDRTEKG